MFWRWGSWQPLGSTLPEWRWGHGDNEISTAKEDIVFISVECFLKDITVAQDASDSKADEKACGLFVQLRDRVMRVKRTSNQLKAMEVGLDLQAIARGGWRVRCLTPRGVARLDGGMQES